MSDVIKGEMLRGQIDTVILLALLEGDKDSNDIREAIEAKSDNQYSIKQGTFYSAMQRLVKQGYIKEYRSSAMDGIRRKYFSITPKGNKFLEANREQWTASKSLVDSLFETESEKPTEKAPEKVVETPVETPKQESQYVDELDSFKAFVDDNGDDFKVEEPENEDSYFADICADVLSDLNNELEKQAEPLTRFEDEITENIEDNSSDFEENYETVSEKSNEELFAFDVFDSDGFVKEVEIEESEEIPEDDGNSTYSEFYQDLEEIVEEPVAEPVDNAIYEEETIDSAEVTTIQNVEIQNKQEDDLLIVEEYSPTNKNKYKQILNKILPRDRVETYQEDSPVFEQENDEDEIQAVNEEPLYKESITIETNEDKQPETKAEKPAKYSQQDPSDFSDLYAMANREGFKIRTSYSTNKFVGNQILLNKLISHSSLVFFIILALECLILNFALSSILNWKLEVKLIILGALAIFPLFASIVYLINSKRSVYEIASFKDAMSVALIITFQLAIIILCVALFVSVDFNNFKEVTTYILLPFILAINIPVYFILKYSLLSTGKYFTKQ